MTFVLPTNQTSQQRSTCYIHLKNLLAGGLTDRAIGYAKKHQIADSLETIHTYLAAVEEERRIRKEDNERAAAARGLDAYRRSQECAETEVLTVTHEEIPLYGDWPETTEVTVVERCPNPKLLKVKLPDQREALMWTGWLHRNPVGVKCQAKIETFRSNGDLSEVIYERVVD